MTKRLALPMLMTDAPKYWQNFVGSCDDWEETQQVLAADWNAKPVSESPSGKGAWALVIEFATEEDFILFVLRWS